MKNYFSTIIVLVFCLNQTIEAQIGKLDTTFNPGTGANSTILTTPVQTDGKIIIGGSFTNFNGTAKNRLTRVNSDGTFDPTFNVGTGFNNSVNKVLIQNDNKLMVVGTFTNYNGTGRYRIARINTDGSIDNTFNPAYGANNIVYGASLQNDGKIVIGGTFTQYTGISRNRIARVNTDGTLDATFNPGTGSNNLIYTTVIQPDGNIIAGGTFTAFNGLTNTRIIRLTTAGAIDNSFITGTGVTGTATNTAVRTCVLQNDGKLLIGGLFSSYNGNARNNVARLNTDGSIDLTFNIGTGANSTVTSITVQTDGKIIIGGSFTNYNGIARNRIARLNSDGSLDNTFNPGTGANNTVFPTTLQSDNKLIIGGQYTNYDGVSRASIARLLMACSTVTVSISSQNNITCNGLSDGSATISASGGSNFTYSWTPSGGTNSVASSLSAGLYTCVATNDCGNSSAIAVTITEPDSLILSISSNTSVCIGASTTSTVLATGGTNPISFNWMPGNLSGSSQTITPSSSTVYTVTATDFNSCLTTANQTITVVNCPGPQFIAGSCGVTLTTLDQTLTFSSAAGATNYRLEITNAQQPFSVINVRGNNQTTFKMSWVSGIQFGRIYNIRISAFIAGAWQPYGNTCTITTPAIASIPTTQFSAGSCNVTLSALDQQLNFALVNGATNYRFEITNAAQPFSIVNVRNNTVSYFKMSWISGIQYGRTYDVKISALVNGTWQPFGNMCQITTPATIPTTQLVASSCGITVSSLSQILNFSSVLGAINYKVEVINVAQPLNVVNVRNNKLTTFALSYVAGTQTGRTYDIRVAANVGGVWASFGSMCQVTVASAKSDLGDLGLLNKKNESIDSDINQNSNVFINVFPNPTNGDVNVESSESVKSIMVFNISGELIANEENINFINLNNYSNGFYIVHVKTETSSTFFRVIKE